MIVTLRRAALLFICSLLLGAMQAGGLRVYRGEWWHFDGPGAKASRPIVRAPLR